MTLIRQTNFLGFLANYTDEVIGKDKEGNQTTVAAEFVSLMRLSASYVNELNAYVRNRKGDTYRAVEMTADDFIAQQTRVEKKLKKAVKKLLWLNNCCKRFEGEAFLKRRVDMCNVSECMKCIQDAYETINLFLSEQAEMELAD